MSTDVINAPSSALAMADEFAPIKARVEELAAQAAQIVVTDATQLTEMKKAREVRLTLKDLRCKVENRRKDLKADILEAGRMIDGAAKTITAMIEPVEARMEEAEKFAERAEAKRLDDQLTARLDQLRPFMLPVSFANVNRIGVRAMNDTQFAEFFGAEKAGHDARAAEAKRAEEDRIAKEKAEAEERARIAAENARLKAEAEAREAQVRKERAEAEAKAKAEREEADRKLRAEREAREAAERESKRIADEAAAKERAAKAEADRKAKAEAEAARKAANAPDKAKLIAYGKAVDAIPGPDCTTEEGKRVWSMVKSAVDNALVDLDDLLKEMA